jgi:hypothetical protein
VGGWHAGCEGVGVPYRDPREALRERIAELERARTEIDVELADVRRRLSGLNATLTIKRAAFVARRAALLTAMVLAELAVFFAIALCNRAVYDGPPFPTAEEKVRQIRQVANIEYRRSRECPTMASLIAAGKVDEDSSAFDPWGHPYLIECYPRAVVVRSAGPDETWNTEDDVSAPRERAEWYVKPPPLEPGILPRAGSAPASDVSVAP